MNSSGVAVAIYDSHSEAEEAIKTLVKFGIDLPKISIVGRDCFTEEHAVAFFNMGDRAKFYGKFGGFWGALAGILLGSFVLFIPVFGHIIILGPLAATIVSGLEGAALGAGTGALIGALTGLGIPKDTAIRYESAVGSDKFLLMVQGGRADIELAESVLASTGPLSVESHAGETRSAV